MDTFEVPASRTKRSICPKQFPSLLDFEWETDDVPFGTCPVYKATSSKGTCTAMCISSSSSKKNQDRDNHHHGVLLVLSFCLSMFFLTRFVKWSCNDDGSDDDSFDSDDSDKNNKSSRGFQKWKKWWKNGFSSNSSRRKRQELVSVWSDDEVSSDESTGLLAAGAKGSPSQQSKTRYVRDDIKSIYFSDTPSNNDPSFVA